jgi:hypothetical protein
MGSGNAVKARRGPSLKLEEEEEEEEEVGKDRIPLSIVQAQSCGPSIVNSVLGMIIKFFIQKKL